MRRELPRILGGSAVVELPPLPDDVDPARLVLMPSLVDLCCDPGFPGFPVRETSETLAASARAGGFSDLVFEPGVDPVVDTPEHVARMPLLGDGVRRWPLASATAGLHGEALSEIGLLRRAGAVAVSDGGRPIRDTVVLRNLMEYARAFDVLVMLRPADPDLDTLGVMHEGPLAARIGLRGNPAAAEHIGVYRAISLCAATGARVHLTHISTAVAVTLIAEAQARGLPLTASTPVRNLLLDTDTLLTRGYDSRLRLHPPLRGGEDRAALCEGVRRGTLLLCADHRPRAPEEKELEFERSVPGSTGLESALGAALLALGDLRPVAAALGTGPRALLGLPDAPELILDTGSFSAVNPETHRSRARNDALAGWSLPGRILGVATVADRLRAG